MVYVVAIKKHQRSCNLLTRTTVVWYKQMPALRKSGNYLHWLLEIKSYAIVDKNCYRGLRYKVFTWMRKICLAILPQITIIAKRLNWSYWIWFHVLMTRCEVLFLGFFLLLSVDILQGTQNRKNCYLFWSQLPLNLFKEYIFSLFNEVIYPFSSHFYRFIY